MSMAILRATLLVVAFAGQAAADTTLERDSMVSVGACYRLPEEEAAASVADTPPALTPT